MSKAPTVSIIIPVYKVEDYLRKALDSVAAQTFSDIEVIVINDGSPDNCLSIIKEYTERYPNFRLIDQQNAGVFAARNAGLNIASGEFVTFLDSDDYLSPDFIERLYLAAIDTGADIVDCGYFFYFPKSGLNLPMLFNSRTRIQKKKPALRRLIRDITVHHFSWNKIYRRSLFTENGISYPSMYFEDVATIPRLFYSSEKIAFLRNPLYHYTKHKGSILATMNVKKINDYIISFAMLRNFLEHRNAYRDYKGSIRFYGWRTIICNTYSIIRVHLLNRTLRGMGHNLHSAAKAVLYYAGKKFQPIPNDSDFPDSVENPKKKNAKD